jgi:hypothetical protein
MRIVPSSGWSGGEGRFGLCYSIGAFRYSSGPVRQASWLQDEWPSCKSDNVPANDDWRKGAPPFIMWQLRRWRKVWFTGGTGATAKIFDCLQAPARDERYGGYWELRQRDWSEASYNTQFE